jgi:hypothetical protein
MDHAHSNIYNGPFKIREGPIILIQRPHYLFRESAQDCCAVLTTSFQVVSLLKYF